MADSILDIEKRRRDNPDKGKRPGPHVDIRSTKTQISRLYSEASKLALILIESMARDILRKHPHLDEFVMGMGGCLFTTKDETRAGGISPDERSYMKPLNDFLDDWDDLLRMTGSPMRFTAEGNKRTEW